MLIAAAREGHEKEVEEFGDIFADHASKLVEVANLACSMSNNEDGVKMVRYAAAQIEVLCPQVTAYLQVFRMTFLAQCFAKFCYGFAASPNRDYFRFLL